MRHPYLPLLLKRIAHRANAKVVLEPEFGFVGEIVFDNGYRHPFRNTNLNINLAGSVAIAEDKGYTSYLLRRHGVRVPSDLTFFSPKLLKNLKKTPETQRGVAAAVAFAERVGFPVFVKPNRGSQGELVCKAHSAEELIYAAESILAKYPVGVVQEFVPGRDYRVVTLAGAIVSAYERTGLTILGDGTSTVDALLVAKIGEFELRGRPNSEIEPDDFRIDWTLGQCSLERSSILRAGTRLQLLPNANLSCGGEAFDITEQVHESVQTVAASAASALGLTLAGIDIICKDATIGTEGHRVIEVNGAPGMDNYASIGNDQEKRVEEIYVRILDYLRDCEGSLHP